MTIVGDHLDSLNVPEAAETTAHGIGILGKIVARSGGTVTLEVADAKLRLEESDILSINRLSITAASGDDSLLQIVVKPEAMIERVQVVTLSTIACADCGPNEIPMLLGLAAERPSLQNVGDMAAVDARRQQWANERQLGGIHILSQCSYSTSYSTTTWFSDGTTTDSQTDKYTCD